MNLQPFDYTLKGVQDPGDSFMAGVKQSVDIQNLFASKEAAKQKAIEAQNAKAKQEAMDSDMAALADNPTVQGINRMMARYPSIADKYKPLLESMTDQQKQARIKQANDIYAPMVSGRKDIALDNLNMQIEAARNAGDEQSLRSLDTIKKMIESPETGQAGDNIALIGIGSFLSAAMGEKEYAKTYEVLGKELREQAEAPAKLSKAQADAMISQNKAKYGENKQTLNTSSGIYERQDDGSWKNTGMMPFAQPGVTVNYGAGQAGVSKETGEPIVYQLDQKTGKVRVVEGVAPTGNMTEAQSAALGFGLRAIDSNKILNNLEKESLGDINTYGEKAKSAVPFIGNALTKSKFQEYEQAKLNFITAVLRKESGAAIGKDEFTKEDRKYFPQPGDSPAVIKQKKNARSTQIMVLQEQAGRPLARKVKGGYEREVDESKPTGFRTVSVDY